MSVNRQRLRLSDRTAAKDFLSLWFFSLLATMPCTAMAAELLHMHGGGDVSARFQLQQSCQVIAYGVDAHWCHPANLAQNTDNLAQGEFAVRADEAGIGVANKAATRKPTKADIAKLFTEKSFTAVSGYGRVETIVKNIAISYTPIHVIAAYRVNNPALPEIALLAVEQSITRATGGFKVIAWRLFEEDFHLDFGTSIYWFERKTTKVEDQLINIAINQSSQVGELDQISGVDSDVGITLRNGHLWLPDFGLRVDRLNHARGRQKSEAKIQVDQYYKRRSLASLGKNFKLHLGTFGVESSLPFNDAFRQADNYQTSLGLQYGLGGLKAFISVSPMMESFGFAFQGPFYLVGIQYSDEKQPNDLQLKRYRMTYVYTKIQI